MCRTEKNTQREFSKLPAKINFSTSGVLEDGRAGDANFGVGKKTICAGGGWGGGCVKVGIWDAYKS